MKSYRLKFLPTARKEWDKLDYNIKAHFKKRLIERLKFPHVSSSQLSGFKNHYKIKLRASGYRLVYEVVEEELFVYVIAVGKRNRNVVYKKAQNRKR